MITTIDKAIVALIAPALSYFGLQGTSTRYQSRHCHCGQFGYYRVSDLAYSESQMNLFVVLLVGAAAFWSIYLTLIYLWGI